MHRPFSRQLPYVSRLHAQRGAAFIVMLVIMVLGISAILVGSLSNAGLKIERDVKTAEALAQAKEALIGKSVIYDDYPGSLPCPDLITDIPSNRPNDGIADLLAGNDCPSYIGRLPWKTLGLPDLRDASGERLWYTLSRNVRRDDSARPINSDRPGTLNVTGTTADSNLIAIIFAPGDRVGSQTRSDSKASCPTTGTSIKENLCAANYLEGSNDDPSPGAAPNLAYQNANAGVEFNDQLITISHDQLFSRVERRVGVEIRNVLNAYRAAWGAYPFAAPFEDPLASTFTGQVGNYEGLLPVGDNVKPTWAAAPSISFSGGGSSDPCDLDNSGGINDVRWKCDNVVISTGETVTITGTLNNVGRGLWRPHNVSNICEVRARNSSGAVKLATDVLDNVVITNSLNADGSATIVFQARGKAGFGNLDRIELRGILDYATAIISNSNTSSCPPSSTNAVISNWLFSDPAQGNAWQHVAYYAVSPGHAPGSSACVPLPGTPSCLTVNGNGGGNDKQAVVIMTGRAVTGSHPSGTLANYLEGENATTGDHVFENQPRSATFNDQTIFTAP